MSDLEIESCEIACAVTLGGYDWSVVVPAAQGFDVLWKVDSGQWYRCGGPPKFEFERKGNILRIASGNTEQLLMPCDSDDKACPGESCVTGPSHRYDTFIDLGTKRAIVRVSQNIPETDLSKNLWEHFLPVTFDETQVSIVGGKCNRQYRFTPQGSHI